MSATFETKINAIRTGTVGELTNVVKRVDFTVRGTQQGHSFELPQSIEIADPDPAAFIALASVTEANVIQWVNENFDNMENVQTHIQYVLDKMVAEASMQSTPLPWAPEPEPAPAPAPEATP